VKQRNLQNASAHSTSPSPSEIPIAIGRERSLTLEQIENHFWGEPEYDSYLVTTVHRLRKKPIADFDIEDLRIMIGQDVGLPVLIPMAIAKLHENIFAEGHYYPGDLLMNVLASKKEFWMENRGLWSEVIELVDSRLDSAVNDEVSERTRKEIGDAVAVFKQGQRA
jgi:hypothetical protein